MEYYNSSDHIESLKKFLSDELLNWVCNEDYPISALWLDASHEQV